MDEMLLFYDLLNINVISIQIINFCRGKKGCIEVKT